MALQADSRSITPSLPRVLPKAARMKVERAIEGHQEAVEALLAFLDEFDGDTATEDGGDDEPSLGSVNGHFGVVSANQEDWARGGMLDLEEDHDGAEYSWAESHGAGGLNSSFSPEDEEADLGWQTSIINQDIAIQNCTGTIALPGGHWFQRSSGDEGEYYDRDVA